MTQKLKKLMKIRNIAIVILIILACLNLVEVIRIKKRGKAEDLKQNEILASEEEINIEEDNNEEETTEEETEEQIIEFESMVQGFRDTDLPDGEYVISVNDEKYTVELINYYDDVIYTEDVELGDDTIEYKTLVVKYHKNLTIEEGVTVTARAVEDLTYKKGMFICVVGELHNEGTISMTARGTYNCEGQDVYLWKNIDDTYEYVPAIGGTGGLRTPAENGNAGGTGNNRGTGGGGSGAAHGGNCIVQGGMGAAGTSYSGGGAVCRRDSNGNATDAQPNGGAGGNGSAYQTGRYNKTASGGAGNKGGQGARYGANGGNAENGENGTGGLLILYADSIYNIGNISSNGSKGGKATSSAENFYSWGATGGSSGGGSINIFTNVVEEKGDIIAQGGKSVGSNHNGGAGGDGSVTLIKLRPDLKYEPNELQLKTKETYIIDERKIEIVNPHELQTGIIKMGNIEYTSLDENIAKVNKTGKITAVAEGITRIKITDIDNDLSTYIEIKVIDPESIYIDDIEIQENQGKEGYEDGTYYYATTSDNAKIKVIAGNKNTTVSFNSQTEIYELEQEIILDENKKIIEVPVTLTTEQGIVYETKIYIEKVSSSLELTEVKLDGKEADKYNEKSNTYIFLVDDTKTEFELTTVAESQYTKLKYEKTESKGSLTTTVKNTEQGKIIKIVVESEIGTMREYTIDIIHKSKEEYLKVNNKIVSKDEDGNYEVVIEENAEDIEIVLTIMQQSQEEIDKTIDINNTGLFEKPYKQVILEKREFDGKENIEVPIKIAEKDGTITERILNIILQKGTYISGRIITENIRGEYIAEVTAYRIQKTEEGINQREEVTRIITNSDGTFKVLAYVPGEKGRNLEERYEIVVTKAGYLDYTVKGIEVIEEQETILEEYKLIAGDIIKTGEIELDDLVNLNDRYGLASKYPGSDLNEDGVIDKLDREIVKKNYTKQAETVNLETSLNNYITFSYSTLEWTNQSVNVTINHTAENNYTLQYSRDNKTWIDYIEPVEMKTNGLIYARLVDEQGNAGIATARNIKNIDKTLPIINTELDSTAQTKTSIDLNINVKDANSGLSKIIWYYKKSTESEYTSETETYTNAGTKVAVTKRKTISDLTKGTSYDLKVEVYDVAGNKTTSSTIKVETISNVILITSSDKQPVKVPVPLGYVASSVDNERRVNEGFVIYEGEEEVTEKNLEEAKRTRNQFVWIPIKNASDMYYMSGDTMYGTYYEFTETGYIRKKGTMEPSLVGSDSNTTYLGISASNFLKEMQQNFKEMVESVSEYGGFYIGRYETGNLSKSVPVVVKMNTDISNQTWYNIYKKSKKVSESNKNVKVNMMWGIQYDETLKWLIDTGCKTNAQVASNSASWGNYGNTTFQYTNTSGGTSTKKSSIIIPTGSTEYTKANNIYDLAGNVWDWTMNGKSNIRYFRGGSYHSSGMYAPASDRSDTAYPYESDHSIRFTSITIYQIKILK